MFGYRRGGAPLNVLALLGAMSFLLYVDRVNLSTAASAIQAELGFSNTELGVAFSAFAYSYAIFQVVGGWIADRIGARVTLLVCGIIWVVTTAGTGLVGSFAALFAVRFVLGIGEGATLPAAGRALSNWTPQGKRGFAQGVTHSCSRLGNALTPPLVAVLILTLSWRMSFAILGAVTAIWVVVWWVYFRDDPRTHRGVIAEDLAGLPDYRLAKQADAVPWGPLLRRMAPTMVVYFCYGWTGWLFFTWLPVFFKHGYGLDLKNSALFASGVFFAGVVGDTVGGVLSDRILRRTGDVEAARRRVITASFLGAMVFLVPVLFTRDLLWIGLSLSGAFFMLELTIGPIWAVPMDIAPRYAGTASGLMNAGSAVAGIVSPIVFGIVIDATGNWTLPFAGSIGLLAFGALATRWIRPDRPVAETEAAPVGVPAR
ncbi:MFS transporter [Methylobacterium sp. NEAU 140]|uniref:MFS transporter n=1 Tax=Methylobacterium sp. NEAU 140 TaxID=3064945 RepID=UPI00273354B1|nr:MFS transporter [Methylobacterium sp. NEAU 140]MDP4026861.1 MFS transporter [Methylobacterium sp. NEAU 140]